MQSAGADEPQPNLSFSFTLIIHTKDLRQKPSPPRKKATCTYRCTKVDSIQRGCDDTGLSTAPITDTTIPPVPRNPTAAAVVMTTLQHAYGPTIMEKNKPKKRLGGFPFYFFSKLVIRREKKTSWNWWGWRKKRVVECRGVLLATLKELVC